MKNMIKKMSEVFNGNKKAEMKAAALYFETTKSYDTTAQSRELFKNEAAWLNAWAVWNR